ncbi:MAG TPA: ribonuclease HII [Nitrospiria bacterium]
MSGFPSDMGEANRVDRTRYEKELHVNGVQTVAGIDEAGRGPLAGPVVAAAVIFPHGESIEGLRDSKKLTPRSRERYFKKIHEAALSVGIGIVDEDLIDRVNILQGTRIAMIRAIENLSVVPDYLLVDGMPLPESPLPQRALIKGDDLSQSIAAASVIAKVTRDGLMREYHERYPRYNFSSNKGYGTAEHLRALDQFGPCPIHRRSFAPVRVRSGGSGPGPGA